MIESDENGEGEEDNPIQRSENLHFLDYYLVVVVVVEMGCVMA